LATIRGSDFALHRSEAIMVIPPGAWDLAPLIPVVGILVFGLVHALRSPGFSALAELNRRLLELEERQDLTERIVSSGRQQLPPPRETTPV
jgi:hypothetical protein